MCSWFQNIKFDAYITHNKNAPQLLIKAVSPEYFLECNKDIAKSKTNIFQNSNGSNHSNVLKASVGNKLRICVLQIIEWNYYQWTP